MRRNEIERGTENDMKGKEGMRERREKGNEERATYKEKETRKEKKQGKECNGKGYEEEKKQMKENAGNEGKK